jgi:hypothetical protein
VVPTQFQFVVTVVFVPTRFDEIVEIVEANRPSRRDTISWTLTLDAFVETLEVYI